MAGYWMYEVGGMKRAAFGNLPSVCIPPRHLEEGTFDPRRRKASLDIHAVANEYMVKIGNIQRLL
jgi:hypothetical protein